MPPLFAETPRVLVREGRALLFDLVEAAIIAGGLIGLIVGLGALTGAL